MSTNIQNIPDTTATDLNNKAQTVGTQTVEEGSYAGTRPQHEEHGRVQHPPHHNAAPTEGSFERLERDFSDTTQQAVKEGEANVVDATASYLEQALSLADTALSTTQTYVGVGKERLHAPHQGAHPPTGFAATLAATASSALDAAGGYIGMAQQQLHEKGPQLQQKYGHGSPHPHPQHPGRAVTSYTKPVGAALSDNVTAAQTAAQPHVDAVQGATQPHVDSVKAVVESDQSYAQQAQDVAKPYVESAKAAVYGEEKPVTEETQPSVDAAKPQPEVAVDDSSK